jgi:transcriptional regulator with XRE-family HTH domain
MTIRERLLKKFHAFKYRHTYADAFTDEFIATQVKVLREQRGLTQKELADKAGMKQSQISELEDVNHRGWKVRTLKKLAKAFDLVLMVKFEPFGTLLGDAVDFDRKHLQRAEFKDDPVFWGKAASRANPAEAIDASAMGGVLLNAPARFSPMTASNNEFDARVSNVA